VTSEVRRIMGPAIPSTSYSSPMNSLTKYGISPLPRRSKQKGKYSAATYKSKAKPVFFQKKLFVFHYMGTDPPNKFTRCDKNIFMTGVLPSLSTVATEEEVREEICTLIHRNFGTNSVSSTDFEFINMSGKQASVAFSKEGFHWDGRAVKELSGSGGIYVRLTKNISAETSSSDEELPEAPLGGHCNNGNSNDTHIFHSNSSTSLLTHSKLHIGENHSSLSQTSSNRLSRPACSSPRSGRSQHEDTNLQTLCNGAQLQHMAHPTHDSPQFPHSSRDNSLHSHSDCSGNNLLVNDPVNSSSLLPLNTLSSEMYGNSGFFHRDDDNVMSCDNSLAYGIHSSCSRFTSDDNNTASQSTICSDSSRPAPYVINLVTDDELPDRGAVSSPITSSTDLANLIEMFPDKSLGLLKLVFKLCSNSCLRAIDLLISDPSFLSLRDLAENYFITTPLDESPRIRLDADDEDEDWLTAALAFYKHNKFDKHASVRITIHGQPGIDTGGIRRQFFSVVFTQLIKPSATSLFEGAPCRLRPAYKATSLSSGLLSTLGTMVAHSILLDGQGFPFLAEYCYHYLTGNENMAITAITSEDVSLGIKEILEKV